MSGVGRVELPAPKVSNHNIWIRLQEISWLFECCEKKKKTVQIVFGV